jgi:hypothetical protein
MSLLDVLLMNLSDTAVRAGDGSLQFGNGWRSVADCTDFEKAMV